MAGGGGALHYSGGIYISMQIDPLQAGRECVYSVCTSISLSLYVYVDVYIYFVLRRRRPPGDFFPPPSLSVCIRRKTTTYSSRTVEEKLQIKKKKKRPPRVLYVCFSCRPENDYLAVTAEPKGGHTIDHPAFFLFLLPFLFQSSIPY